MNFSKRKIIKDSLIYTILPKISFLASFLILPWITPYLTLEDYGIYGLLLAYITVFQSIMLLGQNTFIQNTFFTHGNKYKLVWRRSYAIMTLAGVCSSLIFGIIMYFFMWSKLGHNSLPILIMVSIYFILSPIDTIVINYYVLKEKSLQYAYGAALNGIITTLTTLITIRYLKMGYMGWIISLPLTMLLNCIYFSKNIFIKEKIIPEFRFNRIFFLKAMKIGMPLVPHQLSLYILGISDRLLLEVFKIPIMKIGFYSQGYNMGSQGSILVSGIFQALSKKLQDAFRGNSREHILFIKKTIIIVPVLVSLIFFLCSIWMREIFLLLFRNPELQKAYPVAIIVLCSYMFWSIYAFLIYPFSIKGQTFSQAKISIIAALFNIIGNIIFIPHYGIWAALVITYISYIIFGFAGLVSKENRLFFNKYINIVKTCIWLFIFNTLLFLLAYLTKDLLLLKSSITLILILLGFFLYKMNYKKNILNALSNL